MKEKSTLEAQLRDAGCHYGYSKSRRHPSMKRFIAATENGSDFINLDATAKQIAEAVEFIKGLSHTGKKILFIGEKPEVRQVVREVALLLGEPYMVERFVAGTLTNFGEIKKRAEKLKDMLEKKEKGEFSMYTKKEQLLIQRSMDRMDRNFGGILSMPVLPGAVIIVDPRHEDIALSEALFAHIPVVAIASTDCDVSKVQYPIVANDAATPSVRFILDQIANALKEQSTEKTA